MRGPRIHPAPPLAQHVPSSVAGGTASLNALLAIIIANLVLQPLTEPDFGWHLRAGLDLIRDQGRLPAHDPYSHTMPDWAWVEHAWLTDLVMGALYSVGGALAVILLFGAVTAAAWLMAAWSTQVKSTLRLAAATLSLWVALPFVGARTQMVTLLGLATVMWILEQLRRGWTVWVWTIPPLFLLWANLHGGFTAGIFYLTLVTGLSWAMSLVKREGERDGLPQAVIGNVAWATVGAAVLTLANPYGWGLHKEILDSLSDRFMIETLKEWHPVSIDTLAGKWFIIYLGIVGAAMAAWYRRIEPVRWGIWSVFLLLAARHFRNIPLFLIVTVPLVAELLHEGCARVSVSRLGKVLAPSRWAGIGTLTLGLLLLYLGPDHVQRVWRFGLEPAVAFRQTSYPIEAVEWIQAHRDRVGTRLVHDYQFGGFLLWWLPGEKIFIDGRMPAWRIGDRWVFKDYVDLCESDPPRSAVLDKYAVDWALLKRSSVLARVLDESPAWRKEYADAKVAIYASRSGARRD